MTKAKILLAGLYASSALASPWFRNKKRDDGWGTGTNGLPGGYGTTASPTQTGGGGGWGYGTTSTCEATTVTETSVSTAPGKLTVKVVQA